MAGACAVVDGDDCLSGHRLSVKVTERSLHDAWTREIGGEGGAIVKDGVAVEVDTRCDVEGGAGIGDHHRTERHAVFQGDVATDEQPVAYIECGAAVVRAGIVGIRRKTTCSCCVAVRHIKHVKAEEGNIVRANIEVGHKLVLTEDTARLVLIDVLIRSIGALTGFRQRRVDVIAEQGMNAARVDVCN